MIFNNNHIPNIFHYYDVKSVEDLLAENYKLKKGKNRINTIFITKKINRVYVFDFYSNLAQQQSTNDRV